MGFHPHPSLPPSRGKEFTARLLSHSCYIQQRIIHEMLKYIPLSAHQGGRDFAIASNILMTRIGRGDDDYGLYSHGIHEFGEIGLLVDVPYEVYDSARLFLGPDVLYV